jgi:hypothetical protein
MPTNSPRLNPNLYEAFFESSKKIIKNKDVDTRVKQMKKSENLNEKKPINPENPAKSENAEGQFSVDDLSAKKTPRAGKKQITSSSIRDNSVPSYKVK